MRYALVNNGIVEEIVVWDGQSQWTPPDGSTLHELADTDAVNTGWLFDGTTFTNPDPTPPPPPPPKKVTCTPWQFRTELRAQGIFAEVTALVAQSSIEAQDAFEFATSFDSDNPLLLTLASQLNTPLTPDQVYDMILSASKRIVGITP